MDRGAWWATVHGVSKSQTRLSALNKIKKELSVYNDSEPSICFFHFNLNRSKDTFLLLFLGNLHWYVTCYQELLSKEIKGSHLHVKADQTQHLPKPLNLDMFNVRIPMAPRSPRESWSTGIAFNPRFAVNTLLSHENDPILKDALWFGINHWATPACLRVGVCCPSRFPVSPTWKVTPNPSPDSRSPSAAALLYLHFYGQSSRKHCQLVFSHWLYCHLASSGLLSFKSSLSSGPVWNEKFRGGDLLSGSFIPSPQIAPVTAFVSPW